jgi:hypothetical protein
MRVFFLILVINGYQTKVLKQMKLKNIYQDNAKHRDYKSYIKQVFRSN